MEESKIENFENKSPVDDAITFLNESREGTNTRLAKDNLEIIRDANGIVSLINKETGEKQTFEIEILKDASHERFNEAYALLAETFSSEELDPKNIMADQMRGLRCGYPIETGAQAVLFTLSKNVECKNEEGKSMMKKEIVSVLDGVLIPLQGEQEKFTGECAFMVSYITSKTNEDPKKNYRQYGFGRELMITAYEQAKIESNLRSMKFIAAFGECTYTSRIFWEKMGWKRTYLQNKDEESNKWKEASYVQPPLEFDTETGEIEEGSGDAPEHFMINLFGEDKNNNPMIGKELSSIVGGLYKTNNYYPPEAFGLILDKQTKEFKPLDPNTNKEILTKKIIAYNKHYESINSHSISFREQFNDMKVCFLNKAEIEAKKLIIEDYITGDAEAQMLAKNNSGLSEEIETGDYYQLKSTNT